MLVIAVIVMNIILVIFAELMPTRVYSYCEI